MSARSYRILLIDDSEISLNFAQAVLEKGGFEVRAIRDLGVLESGLGDWVPDLILTDVNMPGTTGDALCRSLKGHYDTAHVPVVLFSSLDSEELADLARDCAADAYLSKRDGLGDLCEQIGSLCRELLW